jgi:hypothetical protein
MGKVHVSADETRRLPFDFHALGSNRPACLPEAMLCSAGPHLICSIPTLAGTGKS